MSKVTLASTNARLDAFEGTLNTMAAGQARLEELILARLNPEAPAAPAPVAAPVAAPAKGAKAYRSAKGKESAKAQVSALWTKTLADAGVKRAKDLTPAQMDAYRAGSKAIWAAVPKTRATKA